MENLNLSAEHKRERLFECLLTIGADSAPKCIAISPSGQTLVSGNSDNTIKVWHLTTGEEIYTLTGQLVNGGFSVTSVAISPDGQTLVSGSNDHTVKVWDLKTGELLHTLSSNSRAVIFVAIRPNGLAIISGDYDNIKFWNLKTGEELRSIQWSSYGLSYSFGVRCLAIISSDWQTLVTGGESDLPVIRVWNLQTGEEIHIFSPGHRGWVNSLAQSPDGTRLVSSGGWGDSRPVVWDLITGCRLFTLNGHLERVNALAFSPDGQTLASGSFDRTIKLWNLSTGKMLSTWEAHSANVAAVAFSPDGQTLVSGSWDKTIKVWKLA